jgi:hypothetical protein
MEKLHDISGKVNCYAERALSSAVKPLPKRARDAILKYRGLIWTGSAVATVASVIYEPRAIAAVVAALGLEAACEIAREKEILNISDKDASIDEVVESQDEALEDDGLKKEDPHTAPKEDRQVPDEEAPKEQTSSGRCSTLEEGASYRIRCVISRRYAEDGAVDYRAKFDAPGELYDAVQDELKKGRDPFYIKKFKDPDQPTIRSIMAAVSEANKTGEFSEERLEYHMQNAPERTPSNGTQTRGTGVNGMRRTHRVTDPAAETQMADTLDKD